MPRGDEEDFSHVAQHRRFARDRDLEPSESAFESATPAAGWTIRCGTNVKDEARQSVAVPSRATVPVESFEPIRE